MWAAQFVIKLNCTKYNMDVNSSLPENFANILQRAARLTRNSCYNRIIAEWFSSEEGVL